MSSNRASSTSRSSATERRRAPLRLLGAALFIGAAAVAPAWAWQKKGPLLTLFSEAKGERTVEVFDLRFAYFNTTIRHRHAPRSESATGERIEVVQKRKECECVRLADYTRFKIMDLRQLDVTYPEGSHVALVRVTWRDGKVREYRATELYGGDGLFPPRFTATVEGQPMEFPLVLPDTPGAAWPEERVVRMILYRSGAPPPPPPKAKKDKSASH